MSRPGIWHTVWINFMKSLSKQSSKKYVGEDSHGNRFYVIIGKKKSVMRGYDEGEKSSKISVEWEAWLRGTRNDPPSLKEAKIDENMQKLRTNNREQIAHQTPHVSSSTSFGANNRVPFPKYPDLEKKGGVSNT